MGFFDGSENGFYFFSRADGFDAFFFNWLDLAGLADERIGSGLAAETAGAFDGKRAKIIVANVAGAGFGEDFADLISVGGRNVNDDFEVSGHG